MSQRRIVMFNWLTANGCFADADGKLDWVVPDDEQVKFSVAAIPNFDTVMFGRRTYELFQDFWRFAGEDSDTAPDPHHPGQRTREHKAIAVWLNGMTKLIFSRSTKDAKWDKTRILPTLDPQEINAIKKEPGKDIILLGSGSIVSQLTQHGLIDEYQFLECPVFVGQGRPLLNEVTNNLKLELLESRRFPSGDVLLRYGCASDSH